MTFHFALNESHNDYNRSTLKKALNQLVKDGVIVRIGNGKNKPSSYQLVESQELVSPVSPESITEISPEYHQQYQHETHDLQPSQENITTGDTDSVTPIPNEYHQKISPKISPDIELEKINNETRENQQDKQSLQLTVELKAMLTKLVDFFRNGKQSDYDFYIHTRLFSNMIFEDCVIMLDQLVELGHLVKFTPSEYGLAF